MRRDAKLPLDQHELRAMVHLMLLRAKQPLEPRLYCFSVGLGHRLRKELRRQGFQPRRKLLPLGSQEFEDLSLGPGLGLLGVEPVEQTEKVVAYQRRQVSRFVNIQRYPRRDRDVR